MLLAVEDGSRAPKALLPLGGIRVADFSWIVAGPQCTRILADLGAEVIRVENEAHIDSIRVGYQPNPGEASYNRSGFFNNLNRNKLSITANLNHPRGREVIERLLAVSDVVVENFSAGVFERLGFGWERLQSLNPRLVYLSLSGYGHSGRDRNYITWGPTAQAVSGLTAMSGLPQREPAGWGFSYLDHTAGYFGAIAILLALRARAVTGLGQYIDLCQIETGMYLTGVQLLDFQVNGRPYERQGNHARFPPVAPHNAYRCADGEDGSDRWIAIAAESEVQWRALCHALGVPSLASDPRFATNESRVQHQAELDETLSTYTRSWDPHALMYRLQAAGVPAGACQTTRDKMEFDAQLRARGFYPTAGHPELGDHRFEGLPFNFSQARWQLRRGAPCLGEHTRQVLSELLGYSEAEVDELIAEAAV